jgi:hypothetical protein
MELDEDIPMSPHRKPYNAVISFPRSGTDFLCSCLAVGAEIKYFREYFNPICNETRSTTLVGAFGDERIEHYTDIMNEIDGEKFSRVLEHSWRIDGYNTTKENFSATKIDRFLAYFNVVILIRKLFNTFPTTLPSAIVPIFNSFMISGPYRAIPLANELNELRMYLMHFPVRNHHEAGILAYIIQHYILIDSAQRNGLSIISYEDLVAKSGRRLKDALQGLGIFGIDIPLLSQEIINKRSQNVNFSDRKRNFLGVCSIRFLANLRNIVDFVLSLSPHLEPTFESYTGIDKIYQK